MACSKTELNELLRLVAIYNSQAAYKTLFKLLYPSIKSFADTFLSCPELAEEVASDVLIKLWTNREQLLEVKNLKVYVLVLAKNQALNIIKRQRSREFVSLDDISVDIVIDSNSPEQVFMYEELKEKLLHAVQNLPNRCKLVFKLVKEQGLSYKETSAILNISVKTVDAHMVTAVSKITTALKLEFNLP
jgi:RNA polymerase sigma-70 factor (family 1)